jgi:transglutaminase-like putative cysteine protease
MRSILWVGLLVGACAGEETLSDEWSLARLAGQEVGYWHKRVVRKGDVVETVVEIRLRIGRVGAEMTATETDTSEERATDGALLRMRVVRKMSTQETETDIRFEGKRALFSTKVMGRVRETAMDCPPDLVGPYRIEQLVRQARPGATIEANTFLPDLVGPATVEIRGGEEEEVELIDGTKERLVRVEMTYKGQSMKPVLWLDAKGRICKTVMDAGGLRLETFLATEERARRAAAGGATPREVFAPTLLPTPHPIARPRGLDRATYRIRAKEEMPAFADDRQSVEKSADGSVVLRIERMVPPEGHGGTRPIGKPPPGLADSLSANSLIQSDAPEIIALAREAVGDEPDPWKAARKLELWVKENVSDKNLDIGFASALEVARDRQGDCTEHAVLLCALCRASGIPARCALGVLAVGSAWAGHAWNEVWIDGRWYALDGTLGQGSVDPAHITLARVTLKDTGFAEEFLGLLQGLGNLEIDATEVVLEGRTIRPGEEASRIEGNACENALWGIRFACPTGWTFRPPEMRTDMMTRLMELDGEAGGRIAIAVIDATGDDLESVRKSLGKSYGAVEETKVDGRPALRVAPKEGGRRVFALGPHGLFIFDLDGKADPAALDALLASVDFDVR